MDEGLLSQLAFSNAVAHLARHSTKTVCGVLTGVGTIENVIPLFHSPPTTGTLEIALNWVSHMLPILGFYEGLILPANSPIVPSKLLGALCSSAKSKYKREVFALCIGSDWEREEIAVFYRTKGNGAFEEIGKVSHVMIQRAKEGLLERKEIYDFDDHFFNPLCDWRNTHLTTE